MKLNDFALNVFKEKGDANAVKARRIISITDTFKTKSWENLKVLDLGCGEGLYSIEAGIRGAQVQGLDGRWERMKDAKRIAEDHDLSNVKFSQDDVRNVTFEKYGSFDISYCLGLLYHLELKDAYTLLENLHKMTDGALIIDTSIGLSAYNDPFVLNNRPYYGTTYVEHNENDPEELKINKRVMHSIGNNVSFLPTRKTLVRMLHEVGFHTVLEVQSPLESNKTNYRITLVCLKIAETKISAYPWANDLSEKELQKKLEGTSRQPPFALTNSSFKTIMFQSIQSLFGKFGFELVKKLPHEPTA